MYFCLDNKNNYGEERKINTTKQRTMKFGEEYRSCGSVKVRCFTAHEGPDLSAQLKTGLKPHQGFLSSQEQPSLLEEVEDVL